jgi:dTDP-4-amino-4,6-dideoxygalactose transaminase
MEIGSDFAIDIGSLGKAVKESVSNRRKIREINIGFSNVEGDETIFLSSGRDCLDLIIRSLGQAKGNKLSFLLPSYLCESILRPFFENKANFSFYQVDNKLGIDFIDLKEKLDSKKFDAVLVINYFGLVDKQILKIRESCFKRKVVLIEDATHSLLSDRGYKANNPDNNHYGDIIFGSYRKIFPVPDGAFLAIRNKEIIKKTNLKINSEGKKILRNTVSHDLFVLVRLTAGVSKNIWPLKKMSYKLFQLAEHQLIDRYPRPAPMSRISSKLLRTMIQKDKERIIFARRENFKFLSRNICTKEGGDYSPLYDCLPAGACPSGFPLVFSTNEQRNRARKHLIKNKIYCPIHWEIPPNIDENSYNEAKELSKKILTIPLDQRYGKNEMIRVIKCLDDLSKRNKSSSGGKYSPTITEQ